MLKKNSLLKTVKSNWAGNRILNGQYVNIVRKVPPLKPISQWRFSFKKPPLVADKSKDWRVCVCKIDSIDSIPRNSLVWLGHSSFLINLDGKRIIIDPVFGNIPFVMRKSNMPLALKEFKDIDYLLVSHDHFDHMDKDSIKLIGELSPNLEAVVGLGSGELIKSWVPHVKAYEAGWYQQVSFGDIDITFLPSQHWGKRSATDDATRLWGAFMIEFRGVKIYFGGDTGFSSHFKEVGDMYGSVDYAILGIGAYRPRWFLSRNHISPMEAAEAARLMSAKVTIPMHYGTFKLSQEPLFDPPIVFASEAAKRGLNTAVPAIGEVLMLDIPAHTHEEKLDWKSIHQ